MSVSVEEVANLLHQLKPHKAIGPDGIPVYFLKEMSHEIAPILSLMFQSSLHQGILPADWKSTNFISMFKKGDCTKHATIDWCP